MRSPSLSPNTQQTIYSYVRRTNCGKGRRIPILKNPLYPVLVHRAVQYRYKNFEYLDPYTEKSETRKKGAYKPKAYWVDSHDKPHGLRFDKPEYLPPNFRWYAVISNGSR